MGLGLDQFEDQRFCALTPASHIHIDGPNQIRDEVVHCSVAIPSVYSQSTRCLCLRPVSPWLSMNLKAHSFLADFGCLSNFHSELGLVGACRSGCSCCLLITATSFHAVYQHILAGSKCW